MASKGEISDYGRQPAALLIASGAEGLDKGGHALAAVDAHAIAACDIAEGAAAIAAHPGADILMIEAQGADADALADLLVAIDGAAAGVIVITLDSDQIDLVAAHLLTGRVHLLCAPTMSDRVSALAIGLAGAGHKMVRERDKDAERLLRLNREVARIAETLARLTQGEKAPTRSVVSERSLGYGTPPGAAAADKAGPSAPEIRQVIRLRRLRDQFFGEGLLEDPAWDMLLDLFAAHLERAQVSVSSLCIAAAVAPTTALRWIGRMTDEGLFERQPDPFDRRRAFMALSPAARDAMMRYWAAAKQAGGTIS